MTVIDAPARVGTSWRVTSPAPAAEWRELFDTDPFALPDQSPEFTAAAVATGRWTDVSRFYESDVGRRFVLPLLIRGRSPIAASMPASCGIGGLVGPHADSSVVEHVGADVRRSRIASRVRPNPLLADLWTPLRSSANTVAMSAHVADLAGGPDAIWSRMRKSGRDGVERARRSRLEIRVDTTGALLPEYRELMARSVTRWAAQQNEPRLIAEMRARRRDPDGVLETMATSLGSRFRLILARQDGQAIAGNIVLIDGNAHGIRAHMDKDLAAPTRVNYLLVWMQMVAAAEAGCRWFHMGESGSSRTIAEFKERFGAVAHPYAAYHLERLPISRVDAALRTTAKRLIRFQD